MMLLIYRRKSVGEITPPCGTPGIFTLLLKCPSSFTIADLSCKKYRIHLYSLPERHTQVSSAGDLRARFCQKLLPGRRKQKQHFFLFLKGILYLLGNAGQLIFSAADIQSVLVTVISVLPEMISTLNVLYHTIPYKLWRFEAKYVPSLYWFALTHSERTRNLLFRPLSKVRKFIKM